MSAQLPLSRLPSGSKGASGVSGLLRATASVASEVTNRSTPMWLKVTGAVFSLATFASLGAAYLLLKPQAPSSARGLSQKRHTPELEATWRAIFERLGELALETQIPLGVVPRYCTNSFRGMHT